MQFELPFGLRNTRPLAIPEQWLRVGAKTVPLLLVRNPRARRYVLRLRHDGAARVAIPRGGSAGEARRFAERNVPWLEAQILRQTCRSVQSRAWMPGSEILFRGERVCLECGVNGDPNLIRFGAESLRVMHPEGDLRPEIETYLRRLAARELPRRVFELAGLHGLPVKRVSVRNQRSRWGSCSRHGTISLNWRLVQAPVAVRDYIILHELAHLKEMNHSPRFWTRVAGLCPDFEQSEKWLKANSQLLR